MLQQGDPCGASRALGIMAHLVGDLAQPMHTDGTSPLEHSAHPSFEHAVDARCTVASCVYEMDFDGRDVVEPYAKALATARAAHPFYLRLIRAYSAHGYNDAVDRITQRQLDRAANAIADLIWSLDKLVLVRNLKGSGIPSHHAAHRYSWIRPASTSFRATCVPRGLPVGGACMPAGVARSSPRCGRCSV
jgi:hypothetical protein